MIDATSPYALVTKNNQQNVAQTAPATGVEAASFLDTFHDNPAEEARHATERASSGLSDDTHSSDAGFPARAVSPEGGPALEHPENAMPGTVSTPPVSEHPDQAAFSQTSSGDQTSPPPG